MRTCKSHCCFHGLAETIPETFLLFFVIRDLLKELALRFLKESSQRHFVRRRAAAKTSSAGMSVASPRSYLVMRDAISASHAA